MRRLPTLRPRSTSMPFKLRPLNGPLFWIVSLSAVLLLAIGILGGLFGALYVYGEVTKTTVGDVQSRIDRNLTTGASADDILSFLDSEGIRHGGIEDARSDTAVLDAGYPKGTPFIGASIGSYHVLFVSRSIHIYFILDRTQHLKSYFVQEKSSSF